MDRDKYFAVKEIKGRKQSAIAPATAQALISFCEQEPDVPYYTMEVNTVGKIIQCRGYKNNVERHGGEPKPQEIIDFENEYQAYLDTVFGKKKGRKSA